MGLLTDLIGWFSPRAAYSRELWEAEREQNKRAYDAGGYGRVNTRWTAYNDSAEMLDRFDRDTVRARARDLERNSDLANAIISAFKRNVINNGYMLQAKTEDESVNKAIEELWHEWCKAKNCDVTGQQSFSQMLRMAVQRKKIDGGILFKKCYTDGGIIPFKIQMLEVDELAVSAITPKDKDNKIAGGIEYNSYNKPVGYWICQYSIDGREIPEPTFVKADDIIFYYSKRRPSQIREVSDMAPIATRIRDANEFITAVSVKERIAACLAVLIKRQTPSGGFGRTAYSEGGRQSYSGKTLAPGMIMEMNVGDDAQTIDPKGSGSDSNAHLKTLIRLVAAGMGLSYESVSRDMSETNYSSARQAMIEDEATFAEEAELLKENVMSEIYEAFVESAVLAGAVNIKDFWNDRKKWLKHMWVSSPKKWIDPLKESNANKIALQTSQKTFKQVAAEQGRDWKDQIDDIAEVNEYAKNKGIDIFQTGGTTNG